MTDTSRIPYPTCWLPECDNAAPGRGVEPRPCYQHKPSDDEQYPVIVEYTHRHVVWVTAEDQDAAVSSMQGEPYEKTSDHETLFDAHWSVKAPKGRYDWEDVMEGDYYSPYQGTEADAHVEEHRRHLYEVERAAKVAACPKAGHPGLRTFSNGLMFCKTCGWLPEPAEAVSGV
jgi:hypothetical protein